MVALLLSAAGLSERRRNAAWPGGLQAATPPSLLVHHVVLQMPQLELRGERDERFRVAEQQIAALDQPVVEVPHHHALRGVVEIDDDVAAEDDVEVSEERDARLVVQI